MLLRSHQTCFRLSKQRFLGTNMISLNKRVLQVSGLLWQRLSRTVYSIGLVYCADSGASSRSNTHWSQMRSEIHGMKLHYAVSEFAMWGSARPLVSRLPAVYQCTA